MLSKRDSVEINRQRVPVHPVGLGLDRKVNWFHATGFTEDLSRKEKVRDLLVYDLLDAWDNKSVNCIV